MGYQGECICQNPDAWGYTCPVHRVVCRAEVKRTFTPPEPRLTRDFMVETPLENVANALEALRAIKPHDQSPFEVERYVLDVEARLMTAHTQMKQEKTPIRG